LGIVLRVRGYGQGRVPARGGVLLLSNHQSFVDPVLITATLGRKLSFMAREPLFRVPLFGALIRSLGAFPVRPDRPDKGALRYAIGLLEKGGALLMFPEGTRTWDGELMLMKGGFRVLVRRARIPVLPVAIDGAFRAWPRTRRLPRPARVRVAFGRPIGPEQFDGVSDEEAGTRVFGEIGGLLEGLRSLRRA